MSVVLSEYLPLLATAADGIQKLRGLILELAVRGKLVPQDPNDEPASELLRKIAQERARLEAEGSLKKSKVTAQEDVESPISSVAAGWNSAPMGEVVEIVRGITFPSSEKSRTPETGRVRCLRTANVQDKIEWDDILYIRSEFVSRDDQMLRPNDIVMSMANSRELVGKVALVESQLDEPATFGGFLGVLRPHLILPRFVMAFLRAPTVRSSLIDSASQTTNIANISLAKLRPLPFPIPPLAEQHRIVAKVDELMSLCDQLEAERTDSIRAHARLVETLLGTLTQSVDATDLYTNWQRLAEHFDLLFTTESSLDALKQTVLQLAVMGKLVPQDQNDEPVGELLQRTALEQGRLEMEGVRKKPKPMPPLAEDDMPFFAPPGWKWLPLGSIVDIKGGKRVSNGYQLSKVPTPYIYIRVSDMKNGSIDDSDLHYIDEEMRQKIQRYIITKDDIYMTIVGATIGKCGLVPEKFDGMNLTENAARLVLSPAVDRVYLYNCLASEFCQKQFIDKTKQVGVQKMALNRLAMAAIPLPPLAEQHRIVTKTEELMLLCDRLKAELTTARKREATLADALIELALEAA